MSDKIFKSSGLPIRKTSELLPEVFQTNTNDKFLGATLDALVQPGALEKLSGYIGRKYGKTFNSKDIYLDRSNTLRDSYQLEPGVILKNDNRVTEFNDYIDLKNQLKFFGNLNDRDDLIANASSYSWTPPIDLDKFVNYREYFWQPVGPDSVEVTGQAREVVSSYRVRTNSNSEWIFFPDGLKKNPPITLYRGQTYEFDVNAPGDPFFIRSSNLPGDQFNYNKGVTGNGIEVGKVIFVVPNDAPEQLYYQSSNDINRVGIFRIAEVKDNTFLDVETEISGKQKYISSNGIVFTNGLRVKFIGKTTPEKYSEGSWFIEGVGQSIKLIPIDDTTLPPISNPNPEVIFDNGGFDDLPFDEALSYPRTKDYITINRASPDNNPWSRYNRWVHKSVIEYVAEVNKTDARIDESLRAKRPIIEFKSGLQLFNHGTVSKGTVDLIDTFTTDVFSTIEGSAGYNIDNENLNDGYRIIFTADTDPLVQNKIFVVKFITTQFGENINTRKQISLVEAEDADTLSGECVLVKRGKNNGSRMFHYDGTKWIRSQEKDVVNLPPKFDVFDTDKISYADADRYNTSTFTGSEIVSYSKGTTGTADSELGFILDYLNINNSGDIQFEFDWDRESFDYQDNLITITKPVNGGYFKINQDLETYQYQNGWVKRNTDYAQPIIQTKIIDAVVNYVDSTACFWNEATREKVICYKNSNKIIPVSSSVDGLIKRFTFESNFSVGDVVTFKVYTDAIPNDGYYEIPLGLENNPLNSNLEKFTLGQINDHLGTIVDLLDDFQGVFPGPGNLRDLVDYENLGSRFLKHSSLAAVGINLLCNKEVNIINSIRFAANEYNNFRNKFLQLAITLPYENDDTVLFFDRIVDNISKAKNVSSSFLDSDMIGSGAFKAINYTVSDIGINTFALSEKFDLTSSSSKAVYVYINNEQLLADTDYEFDSTFGFVRINKILTEGDVIVIKEYFSTSFNFIPPTPTKLGLYKKYTPKIFVDDTYLVPKNVIQGHDGSITLAYNDFRDELLLELEKRIYNNIKINYNENIFNNDKLISSFYETGIFKTNDFNKIINQDFLRWSLDLNLEIYKNDYYDSAEPFTYTYLNVLDAFSNKPLPGYWRGIYQSIYDTDRPHKSPWEMLGFSEQPTWWEDEYGPAPYTSGNLILWEDLRNGVIKSGNRAGTYSRYARPNLLDIIPVDDEGNLADPLSIPLFKNYTSEKNQSDFKFGDISPVEYSWRKSTAYSFSVISAFCLLKPFEFITTSLDRSNLEINDLDQIVYKSTNNFIRLENLTEILNQEFIRPSGLFYYIENYLKVNLKDKRILSDRYKNLDVRITNRIGGFVDKEQQKYLLDSKSPQSRSSSVFIPPEDYEIFFNVSSPIRTLSYSGIIVEKTDRGWSVSGYDKLNTYFEYYRAFETSADPIIFVGGVSEAFTDWAPTKFYGKGNITKYQNVYYRALVNHTSVEEFETDKWIKITQVPIVGAIQAFKRSVFDTTEILQLPYKTVFDKLQDVVNFILGYGERLKAQGIVFDEYSREIESVVDWETSCKEFMFWTSHNWAPGALISLSPGAIKLKIESTGGVVDNLLDSFYEYNIFKSDGTKLPSKNIEVGRSYNEFSLMPVDIRDGIYFARINYLFKEHVVVFNNRTIFNDVIFDQGAGYRQQRIKVSGFRTADWDGDYTSPGFLFDNVDIKNWEPYVDYGLGDIVRYKEFNYVSKIFQAGTPEFKNENWDKLDSMPTQGLVTNFDYKISQFEDFYNLDSEGLGSSQRNLARHFIGYQERSYLQDIAEDPVTQYQLYQGFIKEKGTLNAITKVFDKTSKIPDDSIVVNEEWAFLLNQFGGLAQFDEIEFKLSKDQFKLNPQPIIFDSRTISADEYRNYILLNDTNYQIGSTASTIIPVKYYPSVEWGAGYVVTDDVDFVIKQFDNLLGNDPSEFKNGDLLWVTYAENSWTVLRYKITNFLVVAVTAIDNTTGSILTNRPHSFVVGDIIGLVNIKNLTGFFRVKGVSPSVILVDVPGFEEQPEIDQSSFTYIGIFQPARVSSKTQLTEEIYASLPTGSKLWLDQNENGLWEVIQRTKQFSSTGILEYGVAFPAATGKSIGYVVSRDQIIVSNPGVRVQSNDTARDAAVTIYSQTRDGLIPIQNLVPVSEIAADLLGSYGEVISTSNDGKWLMIGSPNASGIPSGFKGIFNSLSSYNTNDTVLYSGKLWKAKKPFNPDGSTIAIDFSKEDWEPEVLHLAQPAAKNLIEANQGQTRMGCVDIYEFSQGQYNYRSTIISPKPGLNERFGSSISIGKQEGIEGTSGDVILVVKSVDTTGGILQVEAEGISGLEDEIYQNIAGIDISSPGSDASFDVQKSGLNYVVTVRNGGTRYSIGDQIKIPGSKLGNLASTPTNDLTITVRAVDTAGSIIASDNYLNISGSNNRIPTVEASFNISRLRSSYSVNISNRGVGYEGRSIVSYAPPGLGLRYYACIKDTFTDRGVWQSDRTYYPDEVVKYPARSASFYKVKVGIESVTLVLPTDTEYWESASAILPTNTEYWEEVSGGLFSSLARSWAPTVSDPSVGELGDLIKYSEGSTILISGNELGGSSPEHDLIIRVNPNTTRVTTGTNGLNNTVTTTTVSGLSADVPIIFKGSVVGGISVGTQYYVKEVINSTSFTIYTDPTTKAIVTLSSQSASGSTPMSYISNNVQNVSISGTAINGIEWSGLASGTSSHFDVTGIDISEPGSGAIFNLVRQNRRYSATVNVKGSRYNIGDQIKILGANIGGVEEAYYMAISAPGALDDKGRVYIYKFNGISWKQLDSNSFVGIFNPAQTYVQGSVVWYEGSYWRAVENYIGDGSTITTDTGGWEKVETLNTGILPLQPAYPDDGSSINVGITDDDSVEMLNIGDLYGSSISLTSDAGYLAVGAPAADTNNFESYKGVWKSYQEYIEGDVVKYNNEYWKVVEPGDDTPGEDSTLDSTITSTNEIPSVTPLKWSRTNSDSRTNSGAIFVYIREADGTFKLIQKIDAYELLDDKVQIGDEFGYKVQFSRDGTLLLVSAPDFDIKGKDKGVVFVFEKNNTGIFELVQRLESFSGDTLERFGENVSLSPSGDTLSVTAGAAAASKDTTFDNGTTEFDFRVTNFRDPQGITGKVYLYNRFGSNYTLSEVFDQGLTNQENFGESLLCLDDRILIGSPKYKSEDPAFLDAEIGRVQLFRKNPSIKSWTTIRNQDVSVNIDLIKNLSFFDPDKNIKLSDIDLVDPLRGKILSVAEQEIDFKLSYDPAIYSNSTSVDNLREQSWFEEKVGDIWWNTKEAKWLAYDQDEISFKTGNWNKLAFGSSIDVYEWVESDLLPSEWNTISQEPTGFAQGVTGTPLYPDDSNYSLKEIYDIQTGRIIQRKYFYWVKNKRTLPESKPTRLLDAGSIASYIENPVSSGLTFAAFAERDKLIIYNPLLGITSDNVSVNIQFYNTNEKIINVHSEYQLLSEGVDTSLPAEQLENKWIDSLVGYNSIGQEVPDRTLPEKFKYGILTRPRQGMFVDRNLAVKITLDYINNILLKKPFAENLNFDLLKSFEPAPSTVKNLYDVTVDTVEELALITKTKIKPAVLKINIINNKIDTIDVTDPGYGYKVSPPILITGTGSGAKAIATIDKLGRITSVSVINKGNKYLTASASVRQFAVLVKTDSTANNYWSIYSLNEKNKEFYRSAIQSYDVRKYWETIDWWEVGFSEKSRISSEIPGLYAENSTNLEIGQLLRVNNYGSGNWAVLERVSIDSATILEKYRLIGRYQGTIRILNEFVNTEEKSFGYDKTQAYDSVIYDKSAATEFRIILESTKKDIFVDDFSVEWNKLFFAGIRYVFSEQLYVNWAFKTSFLNAVHNVGYLEQKPNYKNDNLSSYQKYLEEVKPYRTKIRDYTSRYQYLENTNTGVSDFDLPSVFNPSTGRIEPVSLISPEIDIYPWKYWLDNYKFSVIDIVISNSGKNYTSVPLVIFDGGGGSGAEAKAYISNGRISKIVLLDGGTGYTSSPTITLVGGVGTNLDNSAKAVAIIGDSKARSFAVSISFDRFSKTPTFISKLIKEKFVETEEFLGSGSKTVFDLKYPSTLDKSKISVSINGEKLLQNQYSISLHTILVQGLSVLKGRLIIPTAPREDDEIIVSYEKNDKILDALNRIDKYYAPKSGMLGVEKTEIYDAVTNEITEIRNDYSQLITGIDYGGVIVQGATLEVSGGWDALPWFTEGWDSAEDLSSDFYVISNGISRTFTLPYVPEINQNINVYIKKTTDATYSRLDYPTYDEYQTNPNVEDPPPATAKMNTFIGDGSTSSVLIPMSVDLDDGDGLVFRLDTSDGALIINDINLIDANISGGTLTSTTTGTSLATHTINGAYSTATGLTASEISIDGNKFVSPDQVPAPEENIPGQVLDSVSIKVFHSDRSGAPAVLSRIYQADGFTDIYDIGQIVIEKDSVIVYVDKVKLTIEEDYTLDLTEKKIRILDTPLAGSIVEVFSISVGGIGLLDYREFVGDGTNRYFLTAAAFSETGNVFATINGSVTPVGFVNSNGIVNDIDKTLVEFGIAPEENSSVSILAISSESGLGDDVVKINHQTITITDPNVRSYIINDFSTLDASATGNIIIDLNGRLLKSVDTTVVEYTGSNSIIDIGVDPLVLPGNIVQTDVKVYVNNLLLQFGVDYVFSGATKKVTLETDNLTVGDIIRIETYQSREYQIVDNRIELAASLNISATDELNVVWFDRYSTVDIIKDIKTGGRLNYPLQQVPISVSYVWVYKNGYRLTPDVDYYLDTPRSTVYIREDNTDQDEFEFISFSSGIYKAPFAYEIFKDILNGHHFTRYSITDASLENDLNYYDTELTVTDASMFPTPGLKLPGVVYINGERIEYLEKDGVVLKNLRRGTLGTSIANIHLAETPVINLSFNEAVPYKESQDRYDFIADGSSEIYGDLPFVPVKSTRTGSWFIETIPQNFGPCDMIEVFVAGRRLRKDPLAVYDNTRGSYSPVGDTTLEAEFSVDGITNSIRLTTSPPAGQRITVIRRTGKIWYNSTETAASKGITLSQNTTPIARFLQQRTTKLL
jgi:hypothetical protein